LDDTIRLVDLVANNTEQTKNRSLLWIFTRLHTSGINLLEFGSEGVKIHKLTVGLIILRCVNMVCGAKNI
jgi:hypothetical protein